VPEQLPPTPDTGRSSSAKGKFDSDRVREDRKLFERYRDERDPVDREMLVERFLPLARELAGRYQGGREPFDDLLQVACLGLVNAIDRFDLERGIAFSSYAVPTILGEIKRHFRDRAWSVRVPRDLKELTLKVDGAVSALTVALHRQPTIGEIAAEVRAEEEAVLEALQAFGAYKATSLDAPRATDDAAGPTLGDTLAIDDDRLERAEHRATLARLMQRIPMRDRQILHLRFAEDLTQAEIGERIGLSQMQVSRIIRRALACLQVGAEQTLAA
jgi:RNA polymerase sigma-B factor